MTDALRAYYSDECDEASVPAHSVDVLSSDRPGWLRFTLPSTCDWVERVSVVGLGPYVEILESVTIDPFWAGLTRKTDFAGLPWCVLTPTEWASVRSRDATTDRWDLPVPGHVSGISERARVSGQVFLQFDTTERSVDPASVECVVHFRSFRGDDARLMEMLGREFRWECRSFLSNERAGCFQSPFHEVVRRHDYVTERVATEVMSMGFVRFDPVTADADAPAFDAPFSFVAHGDDAFAAPAAGPLFPFAPTSAPKADTAAGDVTMDSAESRST